MKARRRGTINFHQPVLVNEVTAHLQVKSGEKYIDATIGGGGHAEEIIRRGGRLLGLDVDPEALAFSRKRLVLACPPSASSWKLVRANFAHLQDVGRQYGFTKAAGILFDLGVSGYQLDNPEKGFSFRSEKLDMRLDPELKVTAADLVNGLGPKELTILFRRFGEEPRAAVFARAIAEARKKAPIFSAGRLAEVISAVSSRQPGKHHPATRAFQALRIAVNDELGNLAAALPQALTLLGTGGRLVVISFHSLEDRIVKHAFRDFIQSGQASAVTEKPLVPGREEVVANPRSRSAKLRSISKVT